MASKKSIFDNLDKNMSNATDYLLGPNFKGDAPAVAKADAIKSASMISIDKLVGFKNHPYRVDEEADDFQILLDSVKENGILYPLLVRPAGKDSYEIISGHRRVAAAKVAELSEVPVIIRTLNDDEATIAMVHSNFYREKIYPSEKAKAYRMCLDAEKHQGIKGEDTASKAGEGQDSRSQVYRYVRLSYLTDSYLALIDDGVLAFNAGVVLSYLDGTSLDALGRYITTFEKVPSVDQATGLRNLYDEKAKDGNSLEYEEICSLLSPEKEEKKVPVKVTLNETKLYDYFDLDTSVSKMEEVIIGLLDGYKRGTIVLKDGEYISEED